MNNNLVKQPNENEQAYLWRVDQMIRSGEYANWAAVTPIVNQQLYDDEIDYKGESAYRKRVAAARDFYEAGVFNNFTDDEYIKTLKEQERKIALEKVKLRDERTLYNREIRGQARFESTVEQLEQLIKKTTPYVYHPKIVNQKNKTAELLVCLSDIHMGLVTDSFFGDYNPEVVKRRLEEYIHEILIIAERHGTSVCSLALLGDQVNGRIHITTMLENRDDVVAQVQTVSEMVSWFISELAEYFSQIYVYSVSGNHSRLDKKDLVLRDERLDSIVMWYAQARLEQFENVAFKPECKYDPTIGYMNIRGLLFLLCHGDFDERSAAGIQKLVMLIGEMPYCVVMGHRHTTAFEEISGVKIIQSGCLCGSGSDYCVSKRITGEPSQAVAVVTDEGIDAFYAVSFS